MKATNPTTQARNRYFAEFSIAVVAYMLILWGSIYALNHGVGGTAKVLVAVAPVLPVIGIVIAVVRWLQGTDEYQRQITITAMAIGGGVTALSAITYGFLENAGLPQMSVWTVYLIFMTTWGVATPILQRMSR